MFGHQLELDLRSMTPMDMVKEFVKTSGQVPNPTMSAKLIDEEYYEWEYSNELQLPEFRKHFMEEYSGENELKELADLVYVVYGYANARGWDLDMALLRVHDNNMGRMYQDDGTILRRDDGKVIKNKNYPKVQLGDLV